MSVCVWKNTRTRQHEDKREALCVWQCHHTEFENLLSCKGHGQSDLHALFSSYCGKSFVVCFHSTNFEPRCRLTGLDEGTREQYINQQNKVKMDDQATIIPVKTWRYDLQKQRPSSQTLYVQGLLRCIPKHYLFTKQKTNMYTSALALINCFPHNNYWVKLRSH